MSDYTVTEELLQAAIENLDATPPDVNAALLQIEEAMSALEYPEFHQQFVDILETPDGDQPTANELRTMRAETKRVAAQIRQFRETMPPPALPDPEVLEEPPDGYRPNQEQEDMQMFGWSDTSEEAPHPVTDTDEVAANWFNRGYFIPVSGRGRLAAMSKRIEEFGRGLSVRRAFLTVALAGVVVTLFALSLPSWRWAKRQHHYLTYVEPPMLSELIPAITSWGRFTVEPPEPLPPVEIAGTVPCEGPGIIRFDDEVILPMSKLSGGHITVYVIDGAFRCKETEKNENVFFYAGGPREGQALDIACLWEELDHCPAVERI